MDLAPSLPAQAHMCFAECVYLIILAEFGDFNPVEHDEAFVSEFRFHPKQDEHMEMSILG